MEDEPSSSVSFYPALVPDNSNDHDSAAGAAAAVKAAAANILLLLIIIGIRVILHLNICQHVLQIDILHVKFIWQGK